MARDMTGAAGVNGPSEALVRVEGMTKLFPVGGGLLRGADRIRSRSGRG